MKYKFLKKCSTSLCIRENIKTSLRFHLTPIRMTKIGTKQTNKKQMTAKAGMVVGKQEELFTSSGRVTTT